VNTRWGARRQSAGALALLLLADGCGGSGLDPPDRLSDGSTPPPVPAELQSIDGAVLVGTRVVRGRDLEHEPYVDCLKNVAGGAPGVAVERVTADGRTLTFATADRRDLIACDGAPRALEPRGSWCGEASGRWEVGGRIADGRLGITNCLSADREPVAYVFVNPAPRARWLVVDHDHFREIYDASDPYPVRISTTDRIDEDTSSLKVRVRSYDADGKKVGDEVLQAVVAG
jgi:hypothetical protein